MSKLLTAIAAALFLAGCTSGPQTPNEAHMPPPPGAKQLNGEQIQQALIGRKLQSLTAKGLPLWQILSPDGTAAIQIAKDPVQKGNWTITNDVICVTYQQYGKECNTVHSDGVSVWLVDETNKTTNNKFTVH